MRTLWKGKGNIRFRGTEFFAGYKYLVGKVDHFFACSEFNATQIEEYCGIRPRVLPNGVDTGLFMPRNPDPELSRKLGLDRSEDVIISACRLVDGKASGILSWPPKDS